MIVGKDKPPWQSEDRQDGNSDCMAKHDETLAAIFAERVRSNVKWRDVEALIVTLGGSVAESRGSRVLVSLNGHKVVFRRPYPSPDTIKGAIRPLQVFLEKAGYGQ